MMFTFLLCICFTSKNRESFFSLLFRYFAKLNIGLLGFDVAQIDKPIWKKKVEIAWKPFKTIYQGRSRNAMAGIFYASDM